MAALFLWGKTSIHGDVLMEIDGNGTTLANYTLGGSELLSQTRSGITSYYLQDGQSSTRALTDSAGNVTDTYSYSAFGELQNHTGSTVNSYQYTGQQFDSATGLYDLRARYYAPSTGRFLSQDTFPVNFNNPVELNRYGYVGNNPVNLNDPSGHEANLLSYGGLNFNAIRNAAFFTLTAGAVVLALQAVASLIAGAPSWPGIGVRPKTKSSSKWTTLGALFTAILGAIITIAIPTDIGEEKEPQQVFVDLGSGLGEWAVELKTMHPNDRVIATEYGPGLELLKAYISASGLDIDVYDGWNSVPSEIADETWAIAPYPSMGMYDVIIDEGKAGLRITKSGGHIFHMVIKVGEVSSEDALVNLLKQIDPSQSWGFIPTKMETLGIVSTYINPQDDVWYITALK